MRKVVLSAIISAALVGPTLAGDLASTKDALVFSPRPLAFNWTGFYAGVQLGGVFGTTSIYVPLLAAGTSWNTSGFFGGAHAGYNYQFNSLVVLGVQTEFNGATTNGQRSASFGPITITGKSEQPWFGSVDGRVGAAFGRALFYAIGGFAYADNQARLLVNGFQLYGNNSTRLGYDIGGGVEWALTNHFITTLEYRHYDYGSSSYSVLGIPNIYQQKLFNNSVRFVLSYKFDEPGVAVAGYGY